MNQIKHLTTPLSESEISQLQVGDIVSISGEIYCGRDAVLPKICSEIKSGEWYKRNIDLNGAIIFHTAVSPAGVGPTSSNKLEIEESFEILSKNGVRIHLGKGQIKRETIDILHKNSSAFLLIPPVTALLEEKTLYRECVAFPELGMEALYKIRVDGYEAIVGAVNGKSIYE